MSDFLGSTAARTLDELDHVWLDGRSRTKHLVEVFEELMSFAYDAGQEHGLPNPHRPTSAEAHIEYTRAARKEAAS